MRGKNLGIVLGAIGVFALWPSFIWLLAQFGWLDERWFATGGAVQYTLPIALALAAVAFAVHGMLLNSSLATELEERFAAGPELAELPAEPVAVAAGAPRAAAPGQVPETAETVELAVEPGAEAEPKKLGGKVAVRERPDSYKASKDGKKPKKAAKVGRQVKQRAGYKAKNTLTRAIRERLGFRV